MKKKHRKHAIITRTDQRPITTRICAQKGCKFFGKEAVQGVCHTTDGDLVEWAKLDAHEKQLEAELSAMKKREGKNYVRALEAYYLCTMMNWQLTLDECIRLRRDNAILASRRYHKREKVAVAKLRKEFDL